MDWKDEDVIVTGGAGFVGSHLVDLLVGAGANVTVYDNLSRGHVQNIENSKVVIVNWDLAEAIPSWGADKIVFHTAAKVTNIHANRINHLGMLEENLRINTNVIEAMRKQNPKLAVLCSTVCVYPHNAKVPTHEKEGWPLHPEETNEGYGLAKGILEKQGEFLNSELGIPVVVTRFSNCFGPRDYYDKASSHVVPALIRRIMEDETPLKVWGTGKQTRCFLDARDAALALFKLAECSDAWDAKPVNIGHKQEINMMDLAKIIAVACGKPDLPMEPDTDYPDGHRRRAVETTRLKYLLDWIPETPLELTIKDMVEEYRAGKSHL